MKSVVEDIGFLERSDFKIEPEDCRLNMCWMKQAGTKEDVLEKAFRKKPAKVY